VGEAPTSLDTTGTSLHSPCKLLYRVWTHRECGAKVVVPIRCESRFCPRCARIRAWELVQTYEPVLRAMREPKFLTLTLKDVPRGGLAAARQFILQCLAKLRRRSLFKAVRSGVWALDVTFAGDWHVHLHLIVDAPYIPQDVLSSVWSDITGGSRVVWIQRVAGLKDAAKELLKYVSKFWEIEDAEALGELKDAFKGKKQCDCWGEARSERVVFRREPLSCPRCGAPFRWREWDLDLYDWSGLRFSQIFGPLWADYYPRWAATG